MNLNKNVVYATIPSGSSLQSVVGFYRYRHLDAGGGGHVLTISAYGPSAVSATTGMTIRAYFASDHSSYADLDIVDITTINSTGYLKTFSMTGFYDIDIISNASSGNINVEISS